MKKNAAGILLPVITIFALAAAVPAAAQSEDAPALPASGPEAARAQADAYLEKARASVVSGAMTEASDFLGPAFDLAPDYSEALYLRARLELSAPDTTLAAIDDMRGALRLGSWNGTDPWRVRQDLSEVLIRTGGLAEARGLLLQCAAHDSSDSRTFLLLARLYIKSGDSAALRSVLSRAAVTFPLVDDFALISSERLARAGMRAEARRLVATQLEVHSDSLPLLLRAAELEPARANRVARVEQYEKKGGKDPLAAVIALEAASGDKARYLSLFIGQAGLGREDLVERAAAAVRGSAKLGDTLRSALASYTGTRGLDRDEDGYPEEWWTFASGSVTGWARDANEDGVPEYTAAFKDNAPSSFSWNTPTGEQVTATYSAYPAVDSIRVGRPGATTGGRSYLLVPYTVDLPVLVGGAAGTGGAGGKSGAAGTGGAAGASGRARAGMAPAIVGQPRVPRIDELERASWRVEEYGADGTTVVRRIDLSRGLRVFMEEDTRGTGKFDHMVWYADGRPFRGTRDLNGDGTVEVEETWRGGALAEIAVDTNGNGKIDYRERYGSNPTKSWDYNEDGIADSREYPAGRATIVREFSTALNGLFDLSLTWRNNRLTNVVRGGRTVPVTPDPSRGIMWIGPAAAPGVAIDAGAPEGYTAIGEREYLVFRHAGTTYAEELP